MGNKVMDAIRAAEEIAAREACTAMEHASFAFQHYYRWLDKEFVGKFSDQGVDALGRLEKCILILRKIEGILNIEREISKSSEIDWDLYQLEPERALAEWRDYVESEVGRNLRKNDNFEWLEILSESFYWNAFRTRSAIRHLPDLKKFEAPGVRNTRNQLIEHPESSHSRIFNGGFAFGGDRGPILAGSRTDQQPNVWADEGLFPNVQEFALRIVNVVQASRAGPITPLS